MAIENAFTELISSKTEDYDRCVDVLAHDFELVGVPGEIRFHHLKTDGNGQPMVKALAETLYDYIIHYCIAAKNRPESLTPVQAARLAKEARKLFRHPDLAEGVDDRTGEAGELLLFFLTEVVLGAPQMVAKMELKTNRRDEVKGADGIHARWNQTDQLVDFYFGESKLYADVNAAMRSALSSITTFHDNEAYRHEFKVLTRHYKYADDELKDEFTRLIHNGEIGGGARLSHVCLIGYDWNVYATMNFREMQADIKRLLLNDGGKIVEALNKLLSAFERKHIRLEFFFMPFPSVAEFRNVFNNALD